MSFLLKIYSEPCVMVTELIIFVADINGIIVTVYCFIFNSVPLYFGRILNLAYVLLKGDCNSRWWIHNKILCFVS